MIDLFTTPEQWTEQQCKEFLKSNWGFRGLNGKGITRLPENRTLENMRLEVQAQMNELDLFEYTQYLPAEVQQILQQYSKSDFTYQTCNELLSLLQPYGYTFEYGLDAIPYNLTKSVTEGK